MAVVYPAVSLWLQNGQVFSDEHASIHLERYQDSTWQPYKLIIRVRDFAYQIIQNIPPNPARLFLDVECQFESSILVDPLSFKNSLDPADFFMLKHYSNRGRKQATPLMMKILDRIIVSD